MRAATTWMRAAGMEFGTAARGGLGDVILAAGLACSRARPTLHRRAGRGKGLAPGGALLGVLLIGTSGRPTPSARSIPSSFAHPPRAGPGCSRSQCPTARDRRPDRGGREGGTTTERRKWSMSCCVYLRVELWTCPGILRQRTGARMITMQEARAGRQGPQDTASSTIAGDDHHRPAADAVPSRRPGTRSRP
jgi:hypothetical protein